MPELDGARPGPLAGAVSAPGQHAAAVASNPGIVQTGDHSQARQVTAAVTLGQPGTVDAPAGGVFRVPKPPARTFVGRNAQLADLHRLVRAGAGVVAQTVHGLGGVGKTELALQYATAHRAGYRVVWWLLADEPQGIETGLAELAFRLHPDVQVVTTQAEAARWAMAWLQSHTGWLLVLDNVEHRHDVEALLGELGNGHVLITTRRDVGWEDITDGCLRLDTLAPADAVALLCRLSGQDDAGTAAVLAAELGCLPLALQQAGAYLRQTRTPMAGYLDRLREDPAGVLASVAAGGDGAQRAVARTWSVTIDAISADNALALHLLRLLACYAPDDLPRDVLTRSGPPGAVDTALGVLASYNMITLTATTVSTHRLVQAVTASQLRAGMADGPGATEPPGPPGPHAPADTLSIAVRLLCRAVPAGDPLTAVTGWPRWAALGPHVAALADPRLDLGDGGIKLAQLLGLTTIFEVAQGRFLQGLAYGRQSLAITEAVLGADHPDVAIRLDIVAAGLRGLGRAWEAEPLQRRALAISEAALGAGHLSIATRLNNLALTLHRLGRTGEAEPLQRRALAISEAALGADHPTIATTLNNLAVSLNHLGRAGEAEPLQRRALAISEAALGAGHPAVAERLNNLAVSLRDLGRTEEAEPLHRRALAITETALRPDHPDVATAADSLAVSLRALGRAGEAEPLQRRALAITEAALGADHPDVAVRLHNLAASLRDVGRPEEAELLQRRALAIRKRPPG